VRDPAVHASVLKRVVSGIEAMGFACQGTVPSPLRGAKEGNLEFLSAFEYVNWDLVLPTPARAGADDDASTPDDAPTATDQPQ